MGLAFKVEKLTKIILGMFLSATGAAIGAFVDVQILKAEVREQEKTLTKQDTKLENIHNDVRWIKERWIEKYGRQ